jgi:LysM repeat protein
MKTSSLPIFITIAAAHVVGLGLLYFATSGDSKPKHADLANTSAKTEMSSKAVEPVKSSGVKSTVAVSQPNGNVQYYTVKPGDSVKRIIKNQNIKASTDFIKLNKLENAVLHPGQRLVIPN